MTGEIEPVKLINVGEGNHFALKRRRQAPLFVAREFSQGKKRETLIMLTLYSYYRYNIDIICGKEVNDGGDTEL